MGSDEDAEENRDERPRTTERRNPIRQRSPTVSPSSKARFAFLLIWGAWRRW
jgi:hypothetical protein